MLWLNPEDPETFPEGLLDALDDPALVDAIQRQRAEHSLEGRLRAKMQADALRPLKSSLDDVDAVDAEDKAQLRSSPYSEEELQEVVQFLRLGVSRLPVAPRAFTHSLSPGLGLAWLLGLVGGPAERHTAA